MEEIPKHIIIKLKEIIKLKKESKEKDIVQNIVKIDEYIEKFLKDDGDCPEHKSKATLTELNEELRKLVLFRYQYPIAKVGMWGLGRLK